MVNDRRVVSVVRAWSGALTQTTRNQASGRAYGGARAGDIA